MVCTVLRLYICFAFIHSSYYSAFFDTIVSSSLPSTHENWGILLYNGLLSVTFYHIYTMAASKLLTVT